MAMPTATDPNCRTTKAGTRSPIKIDGWSKSSHTPIQEMSEVTARNPMQYRQARHRPIGMMASGVRLWIQV